MKIGFDSTRACVYDLGMNKNLIARIKKAVHQTDPQIKEDEDNFKVACVLLGSANIGPKPIPLAKAFNVPAELMGTITQNFEKNKIWDKGKVTHSGWFDKEAGGIAFWMDVMCGTGLVERSGTVKSAGSKGGKSGVGKAKKRGDSEHYSKIAQKRKIGAFKNVGKVINKLPQNDQKAVVKSMAIALGA